MKRLALCLVLLVTPLLVGGGVYVAQSNTDTPSAVNAGDHWAELQRKIEFQVKHFPGTAGIYIKDVKRGWVIEHNADTLFPSASLVKIPVMAALYDAQSKGRISLDEVLTLQRRMRAAGSGSLRLQRAGTKYTVRQLIYKMITESDNTATNMLTDYLGLDYYNSSFLKMGLTHTNFSRMIMDLRKRDQGIENYTSPRDMASLLELIYGRDLTGSDEMLAILKGQKINDRLAVSIPASWQIGHKTGLMRDSCHDVGIVFAPSSDYIICVLTSNVRNLRRAKNFISEISHITAIYYGDPSLQPADEDDSILSRLWPQSGERGQKG